jgi:hypothetical protein
MVKFIFKQSNFNLNEPIRRRHLTTAHRTQRRPVVQAVAPGPAPTRTLPLALTLIHTHVEPAYDGGIKVQKCKRNCKTLCEFKYCYASNLFVRFYVITEDTMVYLIHYDCDSIGFETIISCMRNIFHLNTPGCKK